MFRYSCFLSYQRGNDLLDRFSRELFKSLSDELELRTPLTVWFDTARLEPDESWRAETDEALRQSICMIPVLTPTYFTKLYCVREYLTMERIESRRNQATQRKDSLLLPVVLRGADLLPPGARSRQYLDFSEYFAFESRQFRSPRFAKRISELADAINKLCTLFTELDDEKSLSNLKVKIPSDQEALAAFPTIRSTD